VLLNAAGAGVYVVLCVCGEFFVCENVAGILNDLPISPEVLIHFRFG
jgi:hypothetical protein